MPLSLALRLLLLVPLLLKLLPLLIGKGGIWALPLVNKEQKSGNTLLA
jgi:hypothetical protein